MLELARRGRRRGRARSARRSPAARSACCSACRRSTRSRTARPGRRSARPAARREGRARCATPRLRRALLVGGADRRPARCAVPRPRPERAFPLGDPPDYEPRPERRASPARAARRGPRRRSKCSTTCCSRTTATRSCMRPLLNYTDFTLDAGARDAAAPDAARWGLGDGGAHCGTTCDARTPTFMLTHWARDRDPRPAAARVGRAQDDGRDRVALRPRRPRRAAAGHARRRQRHRPRPAAAAPPGDGARPARRRPPLRAARRRLRRDGRQRRGRPARRRATGALPGRLLRGAR